MESLREDESYNNSWGVSLEEERIFWKTKLIEIFIIIPTLCPICQNGKILFINHDSIINPFLGKCTYYKCRRALYLRNNTIFSNHNKTHASDLYYIMEIWIHDEFNAEKIYQIKS